MKRYKITLMVPHSTEIVVPDAQAAHNEATRLANAPRIEGEIESRVHSVEFIEDVITEEMPFDDALL